VDDAVAVHVLHSVDRLSQEEARLRPVAAHLSLRAVEILLHERPQISARHVLHLVVQRTVVLEGAIQRHDTIVIQLVQRLQQVKHCY
jgi:hypothetical protein